MKRLLRRLLVLCVCLTLLWLSPGAMPKSYAAGRALRQAQDGSSCDPNIPRNTGVSSDADWYGFEDSDNGQPFGYFRSGSSAAIGAWTCGSNSIVLFVSPHFPSSSVYVWTMLNGVWSLANNLPFNYYDPDSMIAPPQRASGSSLYDPGGDLLVRPVSVDASPANSHSRQLALPERLRLAAGLGRGLYLRRSSSARSGHR